jgi:hypothetical protein
MSFDRRGRRAPLYSRMLYGMAVASAVLVTAAILSPAVGAPQRKPSARHAPPVSAALGYNRDIRPILTENCFTCHGPDANKRAAGLRLDRREDALGKGVIVPGKPDKSRLLDLVFARGGSS